MFFSVLTATFFPARSLGDLTGLSPLTTTPPKSAPAFPVEATPLATARTGTLRLRATISDVVLLNPNWNCPLTTPGTIAAPPWLVSSVRSRPRSL